MLTERLLENYREQLDRIETDRMPAINAAAAAVSQALAAGGAWHVHDTGHIIDRELIHRGGGLMCIRPFAWTFSVNDPVPTPCRERPPADPETDITLETVRLAVRASSIRRGDVITIGSVSGRSAPQVELALLCRDLGATVVVISAVDYSSQVTSRHPSGKRLFECGDIVIDNGAPFGDGHMVVPGYDVPLFPLSGINAAVIMWLICAGVVDRMRAAGLTPQVWKSANIDGGGERNRRIENDIVNKVGY